MKPMKKRILITGAAGFIGFHVCKKLIENHQDILGLDNLNSYYDISLKEDRLAEISKISKKLNNKWKFLKIDLENTNDINKIFIDFKPNIVIHLGAQAGVRFSITNPHSYVKSNLVGFVNIIEACRNNTIDNLIYASSSSVYGGNTKTPFHEDDPVNHQVSLYAATKRSNELIAHVYSHLYQIPCTGLRFFTVYGPWGRPDMAPMIFTKAIFAQKPIYIFNKGQMMRDFTYIDDVTEGIIKLINKPATPDPNFNLTSPMPSSSWSTHRIFNIGNQESISLMKFIKILEDEIGIDAIKVYEDMQKGDVKITSASTDLLEKWTGFKPYTPIQEGIKKFVSWYKFYYDLEK